METPWGREVCTHLCIHPLIHSYLPQLFTESPHVRPQLGTAMQSSRLQPSLLRGLQFHGETLTLKGHQTRTGPRAWPSHPWHIKGAGTLRPPPRTFHPPSPAEPT